MESSPFKGRLGNEVVEGQVVRLDYQRFEKKSFYKCTLVYGGGLPPTLIDCDFVETFFAFEGNAQNTVGFLNSISRSSGDGKKLIKLILGLDDA